MSHSHPPAASPFQLGPERVILDHAMQPFLFRAAGGELLVSAHDPFQKVNQLNRFPHQARHGVSYDQGRNWQPIGVGAGTVEPYFGHGLARPDGRFIWLYYYAYRDGAPSGPYAGQRWWSDDGFRTFHGPEPITFNVPGAMPNVDDGNAHVDIVCLHRSLVALPDGALLACAYGRFEGDDASCDYLSASKKWRSILLRSTDDGQTWDYVSTIAVDDSVGQEGFDEPDMVRVARGPFAGRLLCVMRTGSAACPIYEAHSDDQGLTWSTPRPTDAVGVDPCLLALSDGRLAFSWGTRLWDNSGHTATPPGQAPTFKLCLSDDGGEHWSDPLELPQVSPTTGIGTNTGYSALVELEPGHLLMAYDIGSFGDKRHQVAVRDVIVANPLSAG
jgi:hypothetical protein